MDEHLEQIAEMLQVCEDFPVDETDLADATGVVKSVREALDWSAKARQSSRDNASARDAYLRGMNEARDEAAKANLERDAALKAYNDKSIESMKKADALRADLEAARRALGIAEAERDTAMDALSEARGHTAQWRDEAATWQARYEGMEAALRVALEVRK